MEEEIKDVEAVPSTAEQTQDPETADVNAGSLPTDSQVPEASDVDEKGVPWKNREAEIRRKVIEELNPVIEHRAQEIVQRTLSQNPVQVPGNTQPVDPIQAQLAPYTDDQLDALAETNPDWKSHIRRELNRRIEDRATKRAMESLKKETTQDRFVREQQDALTHIGSNYEEAFITLPTGQRVWNTASPLYQRAVSLYQSRPSFKDDGWGLAGAFDMAYGQIAREQKLQTTKKQVQLTAQQRKQEKAQAQAMSTGGQSAPVAQGGTKLKLAKLMEQHRQTGDPKTMAEILKLKGAMPVFD